MIEIPRRELLRGAAASAALAAMPHATRARAPSKLTDIDHIIILMKENRSFDHYFGSLSGVRGFADPTAMRLADGRSVFEQPDPNHPEGFVLPFHLDTERTNAQRLVQLNHSWNALHACWNGGKMDRWIPAHRAIGHPLLGRKLTWEEYDAACAAFESSGLESGWLQELEEGGG